MEYYCKRCGESFVKQYTLIRHIGKNTCKNKKPTDVNMSHYLSIRKKIISLYDIYDIDNDNRISMDNKQINMEQFNLFIEQIATLDKNDKNDRNYYACVIEQLTCFLIYPRTKNEKNY